MDVSTIQTGSETPRRVYIRSIFKVFFFSFFFFLIISIQGVCLLANSDHFKSTCELDQML